jgi:hypothetical protein
MRVMNGDELSDPYFNAASPVVRQRLKQAGVRLAHLRSTRQQPGRCR